MCVFIFKKKTHSDICSTKDIVVGSRDLGFVIEGSIGGGDVVDDGVRRIELVVIGGGGPIVVIVAVPAVLRAYLLVYERDPRKICIFVRIFWF